MVSKKFTTERHLCPCNGNVPLIKCFSASQYLRNGYGNRLQIWHTATNVQCL